MAREIYVEVTVKLKVELNDAVQPMEAGETVRHEVVPKMYQAVMRMGDIGVIGMSQRRNVDGIIRIKDAHFKTLEHPPGVTLDDLGRGG